MDPDGYLPLVGMWLLEYACRHRMWQVLQDFPFRDFQLHGPTAVRLSLCVLESLARDLNTYTTIELEMALGIIEKLYECSDNIIPFKLYFKVSSGLKAMLLLNMLENSEEKVLEKCEELMPRDGVSHPKAKAKEKVTYSSVIRKFRKMFLPMVASNQAWRTFRCTRLPDVYGNAFQNKLKGCIISLVTKLEQYLPTTVLEQILKGKIPEIAHLRSVSIMLLMDHLYNKTVLSEEEVMDLMSALLSGSIFRLTENLGNVLDSQPSDQESCAAEMEDNMMEVDRSPEIITTGKDNSRGNSTSSEEIVEGTPDELYNKRYSIFSQRTTDQKYAETISDNETSLNNHSHNNVTSSSNREDDTNNSPPNTRERRTSNHQDAFLNFLYDKGITVPRSKVPECRPPDQSDRAENSNRYFTVVSPLSYKPDSVLDRDVCDDMRIVPSIDLDQFAAQDDTVSSSCPDSSQIFTGSHDSSFHTCDSKPGISEKSDQAYEEDLQHDQYQHDDIGMQVVSPIRSVTPGAGIITSSGEDCSFGPTHTPSCFLSSQPWVSRDVSDDHLPVADSSYNSADELESVGFEVNKDTASPSLSPEVVIPSSYSFVKYEAVCGNPTRLLRASLPPLTKHLKPCSVRTCIVKLFKQDVTHDGCPVFS